MDYVQNKLQKKKKKKKKKKIGDNSFGLELTWCSVAVQKFVKLPQNACHEKVSYCFKQ